MKLAIKLILTAVIVSSFAACSTLSTSDNHNKHISNDPFEGVNRKIYAFNNGFDKAILRPIAQTYSNTIPRPAKDGISQFFSNLSEPISVLNNLLQGKFDRALSSTYRFAVNSTVGVFGLFDVATSLGVKTAKEDFGQTLAAWGVGPGPYLILPLGGPSNLRDGFGRISDGAIYYPFNEITDSSRTLTGLILMDILVLRTSLLGIDNVLDSQLDPYAFLKRAFENNRIEAIYDDNPPVDEYEDYEF